MKPRPRRTRIILFLSIPLATWSVAPNDNVCALQLASGAATSSRVRSQPSFLIETVKMYPGIRPPQVMCIAFAAPQGASCAGRTQAGGERTGSPTTIGEGVTETVGDIQKREKRKRGRKPKRGRESGRRAPYPDRRNLPQNPQSPPTSQFPPPNS